MQHEYSVTITREIDLDVIVKHREGLSPTFQEPGEPDEWWIEQAVESLSSQPVELSHDERERAIMKGICAQRLKARWL